MENSNQKGYFQSFLDLRRQMKDGMATWRDAQDLREQYQMTPVSLETLRKGALLFDEYNEAGWVNAPCEAGGVTNQRETVSWDASGRITSDRFVEATPEEINDPAELLKLHGYSPVNFKLISARHSKWQQGGKQGVKELYASKIVVEPVKNGLDLEDLREFFSEYAPEQVKEQEYTNYSYDGQSVVFCCHDLHLGRFANSDITGTAGFDLEKARQRMISTLTGFKTYYRDRNFEEIVFPVGQDFFNSGFDGATTTNKHPQDNCADFQTIFKYGTQVLIDVIDKLADVAPVKLVGVPGNHGYFEETVMFMILEAYFRNDKRVSTELGPEYRKYHVFGQNLIGFTHGSDLKDKIWAIMQQEVPRSWGVTDHRYFLTGHIHHLKVEERNGIEVWSVPALCNNDRWTSKHGWQSRPRAMCFVFDKNFGMDDIKFLNVYD